MNNGNGNGKKSYRGGDASRLMLIAVDGFALTRKGATIAEIVDYLNITRRRGSLTIAPQAARQTVRRLRLAGLVRRSDGKKGPGFAATYTLTEKGRRELKRRM